MNRTESLKLWRAVADGGLEHPEYVPFDLKGWIREVAVKVLEADKEPNASQRPYGITRAVGLEGREDSNVKLREYVESYAIRFEFPIVGSPDEETSLARMVSETLRDVQLHDEAIRKLAQEPGTLSSTADILLRGVYAKEDKRAKDLIREILKPLQL